MSNPGLAREFLRTVGERTRETEEWLRRGALQIEFARAFAKALPVEETATWAEAIDRAEGLISSADPAEGPDSLRAATLAAEGVMAPIYGMTGTVDTRATVEELLGRYADLMFKTT